MVSKNNSRSKFRFEGFQRPNYTQVPDELFDELLPELTDGELRVLLYIIRRTFGFKKDYDHISLKQMVEGISTKDGRVLDRGAGLSKASVARAVAGLAAKGIISATRNISPERGNEPTTYALRFRGEFIPIPEQGTPLSKIETRGVSLVRQGLVSELDTQETVRQETVEQQTDSSKGRISNLLNPTASRFSKTKDQDFENKPDPDLTRRPRVGGASGLQPIGNLITLHKAQQLAQVASEAPIAERKPPRRGTKRVVAKATEWIRADVERYSDELHDREHTPQNIGQAARLFAASGLSEAAFCQLMGEARSITKGATIRKRATGPEGEYGFRNKMPYFFKVLRDLLGMKAERSADRPQAPPG